MGTGGVCAGMDAPAADGPHKTLYGRFRSRRALRGHRARGADACATDLKAHPTPSSLNKGALIPA